MSPTATDRAQAHQDGLGHVPLRHAKLPRWAPWLVGVLALALGLAAYLLTSHNLFLLVLVSFVVFVVALPLWSRIVENRRAAKDRLATTLIFASFALAMFPLISLSWTVIEYGAAQMSVKFLTYSMFGVAPGGAGGIYHAIIGTILITVMATVISAPVGVFTAIYLVEYGNSWLSRTVTLLVDVMTGIPSIVAGLFAYALFLLLISPAYRSGFAGAVALSVLMIPIVVRSTEEMLKLVPDTLREASIALGVPKWLTIVKVVLPTAMSGIITGITLAVARVAGETAPLLLVAGFATSVNSNLFSERMMTLPVFVYHTYTVATTEIEREQAWGAALVLIVLVMGLNLLARLLGRIFTPKTGH